MTRDNLPVAVIGGGPIGLAAAVHLLQRGLPVKVYEAGVTVAASVRDWGHVRLFSALALQHRCGGARTARAPGLAGAAGRCLPDGTRPV